MMAATGVETLRERLRELGEQARRQIEAAADAQALEALRVQYLGKKSEFSGLLKALGQLGAEDRKRVGMVANEVKTELGDLITRRREAFDEAERQRRLAEERLDVTLPGRPVPRGHLHPVTQGIREICGIFVQMGFEVATGPDIEDDYHNFEALNFPPNHPARDMQDTFYMRGGGLLRTHTSPVQIRTMRERKPPLAVVAPGHTYRCDADSTHLPMFTQIEGFIVDENIRMSDLKGVLQRLIHAYFGADRTYRMRPSFFPFTEPSAEVDIRWENAAGEQVWFEVLGAGMIHPAVLENVGYDPQRVSGFAFGLGVERFVMLKHGIKNIKHLYENDLRFLRQF